MANTYKVLKPKNAKTPITDDIYSIVEADHRVPSDEEVVELEKDKKSGTWDECVEFIRKTVPSEEIAPGSQENLMAITNVRIEEFLERGNQITEAVAASARICAQFLPKYELPPNTKTVISTSIERNL